MWYLKFKYRHSDCIYASLLVKTGVKSEFYYLGSYVKGKYVYTSAMQHLSGEKKKIKSYIRKLKRSNGILKTESYGNVIFTLARHKKELVLYESAYNPLLIYVAPAYLSKDGFEIIEVACWSRKPLQNLITSLEKNKTTTYFKILQFNEKHLDDIYVARLLPKLAEKQKEALTLAFKENYYKYPRKTNLDKLSKLSRVSKQTFRENLRRAEAKIIPKLILE